MSPDIQKVTAIEPAFAETLSSLINSLLKTKDEILIALSGGPTAKRCYEYFFSQFKSVINFDKLNLIIGDERCVSESDPDSNYGMIKSILELNSILPAKLVPLSCNTIGKQTQVILDAFKTIDIIHLGLGGDGHTASLFPDSPALKLDESVNIALNEDPHGVNPHKRITLTLGPINSALYRIITVSGAEKADILKRALDGEPLPINQLNRTDLIWLIDEDAASKLA